MEQMINILPDISKFRNDGSFSWTRETANAVTLELWRNNNAALLRHFSVFASVEINSEGEFTTHMMSSYGIGFQNAMACDLKPLPISKSRQKKQKGCASTMYFKECPIEIMDSCYQSLITYDANGKIDDGGFFLNFMEFIGNHVQRSARVQLAVGGRLKSGKTLVSGITHRATLSDREKFLFDETAATCEGYVTYLDRNASEFPNLNVKGILTDVNGNSNYVHIGGRFVFTGNVLDVFENLERNAPQELSNAMLYGKHEVNGIEYPIVLLCDTTFLHAVKAAYKLQAQQPLTNGGMLMPFGKMSGNGIEYYTINDIPVVADPDIDGFSPYVNQSIGFVALTVASNLQKGTSLAHVTDSGTPTNVSPFQFMQKSRLDGGHFSGIVDMVTYTDVADESLIVSSQVLSNPL